MLGQSHGPGDDDPVRVDVPVSKFIDFCAGQAGGGKNVPLLQSCQVSSESNKPWQC